MDFNIKREVLSAHIQDNSLWVDFNTQANYKDAYNKKITAMQVHTGKQLELDLETESVMISEAKTLNNVHAHGCRFELSMRTVTRQNLYKQSILKTYSYSDGTVSVGDLEASRVILQYTGGTILARID